MLERLKEIIADYVEIDVSEITEDSDIRTDLELSSFDLVNMIVALEDEFDVSISDQDIASSYKVSDILKLLEK